MMPDIRQPRTTTPLRLRLAKSQDDLHQTRRELARVNRELREVPKPLRVICRIVGRMLKGRE